MGAPTPFVSSPHVRDTALDVSGRRTKHERRVRRTSEHHGPAARDDEAETRAIEDHELIAQVLGGRSEAFGALVERYERAVYHLTYRTLRDVEDAKDATQEAFIKAYRSLHTFRPDAKFSTWIFTIAYRVSLDRIEKRKRSTPSEAIPDTPDPGAGPETTALQNDEARRLRAAIDALPEKYRIVITLFHLQGKQYDEIAAVLGLPMGTVKTHLFRAKDALRKALEHDATLTEGSTA